MYNLEFVNHSRLLNVSEMANVLGCSTETLRRYVQQRIITRGVYSGKKFGWLRFDQEKVLTELNLYERNRDK